MNYTDIILLAIALSIDACVVSFAYGLVTHERRAKTALSLAFATGLFQFIMPIIGFLGTNYVKEYLQPYAKWIVFVIFLYLGINFIVESFQKEKEPKLLGIKEILLLSIATSIDAFSAGIYMSLCINIICIPSIIIGIITFADSMLGFWIGSIFKKFKPQALEILGGVILIFLAIKAII